MWRAMLSENRSRLWYLLVPLLMLAAVLPFLGKPPHIDEESYLFIGQSIRGDLLHPYHWWRPWQPDYNPAESSFIYAHPPLHLWLMGVLQGFWGLEQTVALRASMLPFALLLVFCFHRLAVRLVDHAGLATLAFLFSPAILLVLHQSLMIDLPYIALSMAGVLVLYEGGASRRKGMLWAAGLLLGLATLTKYPALALLPLALLSLESSRRLWQHAAWPVLAGLAMLVVPWELWTLHAYGALHLPYVLEHAGEIARSPLASRLIGCLAQLGWSLFAPPLLALELWPRAGRLPRLAVALGVALGLLILLRPLVGQAPSGMEGLLGRLTDDLVGEVPKDPWLFAQLTLAFAFGVLALSAFRLLRGPDRFLTAWALLMLGTALVAHNFAGARYLAPAAAPLHLLFWRRLERDGSALFTPAAWLATVAGALITLWIARADDRLARVYPVMGQEIEALVAREGVTASRVWFSGEWGFRWEMERRGYRYLSPVARPAPGDLVVVPKVACPGDLSTLPQTTLIYQKELGAPGMRTLAPGEGIGYYSEVIGLLPYGETDAPLEVVRVLKVR